MWCHITQHQHNDHYKVEEARERRMKIFWHFYRITFKSTNNVQQMYAYMKIFLWLKTNRMTLKENSMMAHMEMILETSKKIIPKFMTFPTIHSFIHSFICSFIWFFVVVCTFRISHKERDLTACCWLMMTERRTLAVEVP